MKSKKRLTFEELRDWIDEYWGLTLEKNTKERGIPWCHGSWTSGYTLSGLFPGTRGGWRRYNTLKEIARVTGYYDEQKQSTR